MAKLLILAYYYPPVRVTATQRIGRFAVSAQAYFEEVQVISSYNRLSMPGEAGQPGAHLPLIDIKGRDLRYWMLGRHGRSTFEGRGTRDEGRGMRNDRRALSSLLSPLPSSYPFHLLLGDGSPLYIRRAYRQACRLIREDGITHVFSSFGPWADHRVAARLKKRFPQLIWWADFRDSPVDPMRKNVYGPTLQKAWIKRLVRKADILSTVSEGLKAQLAYLPKPVQLLRNAVWNLPAAFMTNGPTDGFRITYTGSLYPGLQTALPLFEILRDLINQGQINPLHLQLRYAGKDVAIWDRWTLRTGLRHLSQHQKTITHKEALAWQQDTHFNLLLSWSARDYKGILTAKLYDYLSAGRPIIALVNGPMDRELETILKSTNGGRVFALSDHSAKDDLRKWIMDAYLSWQFSGAFPWAVNRKVVENYAWPKVLANFMEQHVEI